VTVPSARTCRRPSCTAGHDFPDSPVSSTSLSPTWSCIGRTRCSAGAGRLVLLGLLGPRLSHRRGVSVRPWGVHDDRDSEQADECPDVVAVRGHAVQPPAPQRRVNYGAQSQPACPTSPVRSAGPARGPGPRRCSRRRTSRAIPGHRRMGVTSRCWSRSDRLVSWQPSRI
jgi:hypothetical protein